VKKLGNILCFSALLSIAGCFDSNKELGVVDKVSYENGSVETFLIGPIVGGKVEGKFDVILYNQYIKVLKYEKDGSVETYIFPREHVSYIRGH
jgi:hypothetical protein